MTTAVTALLRLFIIFLLFIFSQAIMAQSMLGDVVDYDQLKVRCSKGFVVSVLGGGVIIRSVQ